jgi:DinB family protein
VTREERDRLLARYRTGYAELTDALGGTTPAEIDWAPGSGEWSVRQIVHHLADADTFAAARLRRILTESDPAIPAYDEQVLAERLAYAVRPIEPALQVVDAVRAATVQVLDRLGEADWQRSGRHSEMGPYSVERWLEFNAAHAYDHAAQIRQVRAAWAARRPG